MRKGYAAFAWSKCVFEKWSRTGPNPGPAGAVMQVLITVTLLASRPGQGGREGGRKGAVSEQREHGNRN